MMIKLFIILFLFPLGLMAQDYTETVKVPGKDAETLYNNAGQWFNESFNKSASEPIKEEKDNGILTGRGKYTYLVYSDNVAYNMIATYILRISVQDGQYKYEFDNIMVEHGRKFSLSVFKDGTTREGAIKMYKNSGRPVPSKRVIEQNIDYSTKVVNQLETEINRIIESLEEKMKQ